jgi:hypothetical protein
MKSYIKTHAGFILRFGSILDIGIASSKGSGHSRKITVSRNEMYHKYSLFGGYELYIYI